MAKQARGHRKLLLGRYHGKAGTEWCRIEEPGKGSCRTPTVIPGAAPPRPRLGRGQRIYSVNIGVNHL